jgi:hypothetical protein
LWYKKSASCKRLLQAPGDLQLKPCGLLNIGFQLSLTGYAWGAT